MSIQNPQGTDGRVFGGDCDLVHIPDGMRAFHGQMAANEIERNMREAAYISGARSKAQAQTQDLCPGCYSVVIFNAALELAKRSKFDTRALGLTLSKAFAQLAACDGDPQCIEEITMRLDVAAEAELVREGA